MVRWVSTVVRAHPSQVVDDEHYRRWLHFIDGNRDTVDGPLVRSHSEPMFIAARSSFCAHPGAHYSRESRQHARRPRPCPNQHAHARTCTLSSLSSLSRSRSTSLTHTHARERVRSPAIKPSISLSQVLAWGGGLMCLCVLCSFATGPALHEYSHMLPEIGLNSTRSEFEHELRPAAGLMSAIVPLRVALHPLK